MSLRLRTLLAFLVVYLVWGSTYFAVRLVVADVPPLTSLGSRFVLAGLVLGAVGRVRGEVLPTLPQWRSALVIGVLLFVCGSGSIAWAQSLGLRSGTAALLVATVPLWMTVLGRIFGERTGAVAWVGLGLGFVGTALLVRPGGDAGWLAAIVVLGSVGWALGSLLARRGPLPRGGWMGAGAQMLAGGLALVAVGIVRGELALWPTDVSTTAAAAWLYLVVFGSVIAFRAYAWLLVHVAPAKVGTYAYVNPVIAVMLGGLAGEPITIETGWAMALVLTGVACTVAARAAPPVRRIEVEPCMGGAACSASAPKP